MSEYDSDSDSDDVDSFRDAFACLPKVKSNTPRARFDVHFYPTFIQLIQYGLKGNVSHRYQISGDNIREMLRLSYSNDTKNFFVLHLKRPIVGGNKATTAYDFVVFNFTQEDYTELSIDKADPKVAEMFDDDTVEGSTVEVFETILTKIFDKSVTLAARNYEGNEMAPALRCTFWDNDEHFLFPLDDGFVNVWKYCQKLRLNEIQNVRFVRSEGRYKTFDFFIYPKMIRAIRRYHIGASKSSTINCFFLEFKAIDQGHYDGLFAYCNRNKIPISTNDFRESASDTNSNSSGEEESQTPTDTNVSESEGPEQQVMIDDAYEAPDPHMADCQREGRERHSGSSTGSDEDESTESDEGVEERVSPEVNQRRGTRSINVIKDETESSSSDSVTIRSRKRSLRISTGDELEEDVENKAVKKKYSSIIDSESE